MLSNACSWHRPYFWAVSISTACYLMNRSLHSSMDFKIPEEIWSSNPVDYSVLRIFECPAYAQVNDGKLAPRAIKFIFLGYASDSERYRLWCPGSKKVIQSRDVVFNESTMFSPMKESTVSSSITGDHHDTCDKVELEVPT